MLVTVSPGRVVKGSSTKTTVVEPEPPDVMVVTPSFTAVTLKVVIPPEGIVTMAGTEAMSGLLLVSVIVIFCPAGGEMLAVTDPVFPGAMAICPG